MDTSEYPHTPLPQSQNDQPNSMAGPLSSQNKNSTLNQPTLTLNQYLHLKFF